jgi:hypothetical protein
MKTSWLHGVKRTQKNQKDTVCPTGDTLCPGIVLWGGNRACAIAEQLLGPAPTFHKLNAPEGEMG